MVFLDYKIALALISYQPIKLWFIWALTHPFDSVILQMKERKQINNGLRVKLHESASLTTQSNESWLYHLYTKYRPRSHAPCAINEE